MVVGDIRMGTGMEVGDFRSELWASIEVFDAFSVNSLHIDAVRVVFYILVLTSHRIAFGMTPNEPLTQR